jgi:hypothetical protein
MAAALVWVVEKASTQIDENYDIVREIINFQRGLQKFNLLSRTFERASVHLS